MLENSIFETIGNISLEEYRSLTMERLKWVTDMLNIDVMDMMLDGSKF